MTDSYIKNSLMVLHIETGLLWEDSFGLLLKRGYFDKVKEHCLKMIWTVLKCFQQNNIVPSMRSLMDFYIEKDDIRCI